MPEGDGRDVGKPLAAVNAWWLDAVDGGVDCGQSLAGLIHDARNTVAALDIYCDLLEEPGVLAAPYRHYGAELRRLGAANRRLLEGLSRIRLPASPGALGEGDLRSDPSRNPVEARGLSPRSWAARLRSRRHPDGPAGGEKPEERPALARGGAKTAQLPEAQLPAAPVPLAAVPILVRSGYRQAFVSGQRVENLAEELRANRNLLAAMVGHAVTLGMSIRGGACPIAMSGDDLTRVLVNLARNAAEAMPGGGHLQIALEEGPEFLTLSFTDSGPGIPEEALESIFSPGYSTHIGLEVEGESEVCAWPRQHRGLGLSIVRSLVSAAGGAVWAANRSRAGDCGAGDCVAAGAGSQAASSAASSSVPCGAVLLIEFPLMARGGSAGENGGR